MKEFIYGRNPVYETLRAKRRQFFQLLIREGVQEKGRLAEIIQLARAQKVKVSHVQRKRMEKIAFNNQGVALEVSGYPYHNVMDILDKAEARGEAPFVLILDTLQDPQNFGTFLRTAESVGFATIGHTADVRQDPV